MVAIGEDRLMDIPLAADVARAAALLRRAGSLAVLTGAGVSAESGIPTFRDADGLWQGVRFEDVATPQAFRRDPALVWRFYNERRANLRTAKPNAGHLALAALERRFSAGQFALITQNVDGLHREAGSDRVLELHGNLARTRCTACIRIEDRGLAPLGDAPTCPHCGGRLRPDVVWFHESLPSDIWQAAEDAVRKADVLLVVGTSAAVYPAAGLIDLARQREKPIIECNPTATAASDLADMRLVGPSGVILPKLVEQLH